MTASPGETTGGRYLVGLVLVLAGGVALSSGGVIIRFVEDSSEWQILLYRAIGFMALLGPVVAVRSRGRVVTAVRRTGVNGLVVAISLGAGFTCYVFAMVHTTVANVAFIISAGPLFAAAVGWLVLRERVRPLTWMVIAGAVLGMALMFADGLGAGRTFGNVIALGLPLGFAVMVVAIRRAGEVDMLPATAMAGMVGGLVGLVMVVALDQSLLLGMRDTLLCLLLGIGQLGLGFMLITLGARHVPAAETALIALSESVLAPIWAWLFVGEVPTALALTGGVVVLGCVATQGVAGAVRENRRRRPAKSVLEERPPF